MAEMKMYINGVTQRQASEIPNWVPAIATNRRAAADNVIERLSLFSVSCQPADQAVEAMTNILVHCVQHMPRARPATTGLTCKDSFRLRGRM
jgi:hypothetical protein